MAGSNPFGEMLDFEQRLQTMKDRLVWVEELQSEERLRKMAEVAS